MKALLVYPCVYVLELEDSCYYIGITMDFNRRMSEHFGDDGSKWTKLHKPRKIAEVQFPATRADEDTMTKKYMELYGKEKVRGGSWCRVENVKEV